MNKSILLFFLIVSMFVTAGCETIKGFGKDLETAGQKIEDAVK